MQIVTIRVRARDLSAEMAAMRKWLDEHRCEPSNFTFRRYEDIISIYAVFQKDADGKAFRHNDRNRIASLKIWSGCSPKTPASEMATNPSYSVQFSRLIPGRKCLGSCNGHSGAVRRAEPGTHTHRPLENGFRARRCTGAAE